MDLTSKLLAMQSQEEPRDNYLRAPMGYPGSKSRSLKHLLPHLPYRNSFIDVCGGTGSVLFARNSCNLEVFNDRNSGIIAFYRCIRDRLKCKELIDRLEIAPPSSREEFIWSRETWNCDQLDDVERGSRWYYAVMHSFASKGWAFGRAVKGKAQGQKFYNNLSLFWSIHNRLKNVQIENQDWRMILKDYSNSDAVIYIDPPYWGTIGIYDHCWSEQDHYELCERVTNCNGAYVAVSGYDSIDHPYNTFKFWTSKESWEVNVSLKGAAFTETNHLAGLEHLMVRGKVTESLWIYNLN